MEGAEPLSTLTEARVCRPLHFSGLGLSVWTGRGVRREGGSIWLRWLPNPRAGVQRRTG